VLRLRRSWTDALLIASGVAVGLAAEATSSDWSRPGTWITDLLTGWALIACGLAVHRRAGLLLATSGLTWFAGNFWSVALLLHRAPLAQLVLTYPSARSSGRLDRSAIGVAYAISLAGAIWWGDLGTYVLAALLLLAVGAHYLRAVGRRRRECAYAMRAAVFFAVILGVVATANSIWATAGERSAVLHFYQAGLVALALFLVYGLLRQPWLSAGIVDLVVDLGETRTGNVRDALAHALGDPTLDVAYRVDGGYVDAAGRPTDLPPAESGRHFTRIERDGAEVAVLVHDAALLDDPALLEAVATATRLASANARLQAEVRTQVAELDASRRRLVEAGDAERRRLEARLHEGALQRLSDLDARLADARAAAKPETAAAIGEAQGQLGRTASDLRELAAGLHPRELVEHGLRSALAALAERSPVPVDVNVPDGRLPEDVELTLFFVCSEALANAWKHARASRVTIAVERTPAAARLEVQDDGVGGATPRSLADRIEAVGGSLVVDSPPRGGTRLLTEIPLP
jgi:signal transduction histidine kinase